MENENSSANTMEPPLKRRKGDDELKYRQLYYSILDRMHMEITDRFSDYGKLQFTHLLDSQKFSAYREIFPNEALNKLFQSYNSHFDQTCSYGNNLAAVGKYVNFRQLTHDVTEKAKHWLRSAGTALIQLFIFAELQQLCVPERPLQNVRCVYNNELDTIERLKTSDKRSLRRPTVLWIVL
ncbi:hypothetical protein ANN_17636 [Periplaneta americana]|uniref:Uncharacterized protein n=1 Tax=Periplaneta americana TaxID=6978 RepID=A0ABQ8SUZ4_PERAM|nr:hypothetical protein ANN_17636 [Periplaneta americana]